jgi:alpha-D-ribose 1-methylphosphonate 5-triphosphate diphosphatase PhnM
MEQYEFDVFTASHDQVKAGITKAVRSRIVLSASEFPTYSLAADTAACLAVAIHGGMPTAVLARY